jgi:SAM-dependent methyltransferase
MGEIFRREAAENPAPFTGERLTGATSGAVQVEHYHRYLFARALCRDRDVLDVASGEGYGTGLLAQVAKSVVGVEFDNPTVSGAVASFVRPNLRFQQGDARALPLPDACVDRVVSFETIEHFDRQDDFLREVRRVLRPGGCFVVSTPDRDIYSPAGSPANPHHVHELSGDEFVALLRSRFGHVAVLRQRSLIGSALLADSSTAAAPLVFDRRGDTHFEACEGLPRAPFIVAVASDEEIPPLPPSLYIHTSDLEEDRRDAIIYAARLERLEVDFATARKEIERMISDVVASHADVARTREQSRAETLRLGQSMERVETLTQELELVRGSLSVFLRFYMPLLWNRLFRRR